MGLVAGACQSSAPSSTGSPVLEALEIVDPTGASVTLDTDAGAVAVSPLVQLVARFDRLLDASLLEEIVGGKPVGRMDVARLDGPGMPSAQVSYQPGGDRMFGLIFPRGPRLVVQPSPSLPSGSSVTLRFEEARVRGKDGSPYVRGPGVPATLTVMTAPFSAQVRAAAMEGPPADAGGAIPLPAASGILIEFSNLPHAEAAGQVMVTVADAAGAPLTLADVAAKPAPEQPTALLIAPPAGGWPAGSTVTVAIGAGAKDVLGIPLGTPVSARLEVQP